MDPPTKKIARGKSTLASVMSGSKAIGNTLQEHSVLLRDIPSINDKLEVYSAEVLNLKQTTA